MIEKRILPAVTIKNLSLRRGDRELYKDFSLSIEQNSVTAFIAPSGHGKTTLLDWLGGILNTQNIKISGSILFFGSENRPRLSYLFQEPRLISSLSVLKNVQIPLMNLMGKSKSKLEAEKYLRKSDLFNKRNDLPEHLSGGEKQRVAIARAFAFPSEILLLDEAFQSQDIKQKIHLMQLFMSMIEDNNKTVIMVTHDIKEAVYLADRIIVMAGSPLQIIMDENISNFEHKSKQKKQNFKKYYINPPFQVLQLEKDILSLLLK